jgi:acyl-CoA thioesterase FadM
LAEVLAHSQVSFRVWPWDCDFNLHLTNGVYCKWLDLARTRLFIEFGAVPLFVRHGWRSVLASQTLTFIREIPPLAQVTVTSRVLHMEHKYFYVEHRFEVQGRLHATALARVAVLQSGRVQPLQQLLSELDPSFERVDVEAPAQVAAKVALLNAKKSQHFTGRAPVA